MTNLSNDQLATVARKRAALKAFRTKLLLGKSIKQIQITDEKGNVSSCDGWAFPFDLQDSLFWMVASAIEMYTQILNDAENQSNNG